MEIVLYMLGLVLLLLLLDVAPVSCFLLKKSAHPSYYRDLSTITQVHEHVRVDVVELDGIASKFAPSSAENASRSKSCSRSQFLTSMLVAFPIGMTLVPLAGGIEPSWGKSYSSNARNMERLNSGDASGGSVYNNNPTTEAGKKRRAMTGCKSSIAREEVAEKVLKIQSLSEKECNQRVLESGDTEFMLTALRALDCPTCPYGINTSR